MAIRRRKKKSATREFTNRVEPRTAFWNRLDKMLNECGSLLLTYYGTGGIGKSGLLNKVISEFENRRAEFPNICYLSHDFVNGTDFRSILTHWKSELKKQGCEFPFFETGDFFLSLKQGVSPKLLEEPEVRSIVEKNKWIGLLKDKLELFTKPSDNKLSTSRPMTMLDIVDKLPEIDIMPGGKVIASIMSAINKKLSKDELDKRMNEHAELKAELIERIESHVLSDLEEFLPTLFAHDVCDWAGDPDEPESKKLIIFLDTYELLTGTLENQLSENNLYRDWWIRNDSSDRLGLLFQLPPTLWVISGRNKLRWTGEAGDALEQHLITALSENDAHQFLMKCGILSRELRDRICRLTQGYPLYLDLCLDTYEEFCRRFDRVPTSEDFGISLDKLIERLLKYMDSSTRMMVECLSLLGTWTDDMAHHIVAGVRNDVNLYINVKKFSFIQSQLFELGGRTEEIFQFDRTLQKFLNASIKSTPEFRPMLAEMQQAADVYFDNRLADMPDISDQAYFIKLWAELTVRLNDNAEELEARYRELFRYSVYALSSYGQYAAAEDIVSTFFTASSAVSSERLHALFDEDLSRIKYRQGAFQEALAYMQSAYNNYVEAHGETHSDSINAMNWMLTQLMNLGRFRDWDQFRNRIEAIREQLIEQMQNSDPELKRAAMENLAEIYNQFGQVDKALEIYRQLLEFCRENVGEDHPDYIAALENIADALDSKRLFEETSEITKDNPDVQHVEARMEVMKLRRELLDRTIRVFGETHAETLAAADNLAEALQNVQHFDEALELLEQVLDIRIEELGATHSATLQTMSNIASILQELKRYDEALELNRRCVEITERVFGAEHPDTVEAMDKLAELLSAMERHEEALELFQRVYEIRKQMLGEETVDTFMAKTNVAATLALLGRDEEAEAMLEKLDPNSMFE